MDATSQTTDWLIGFYTIAFLTAISVQRSSNPGLLLAGTRCECRESRWRQPMVSESRDLKQKERGSQPKAGRGTSVHGFLHVVIQAQPSLLLKACEAACSQ